MGGGDGGKGGRGGRTLLPNPHAASDLHLGSGYVQPTEQRNLTVPVPMARPLGIRLKAQGLRPLPDPPMPEALEEPATEGRDHLDEFLDELHTLVGVEEATPEEARAAREARAAAEARRGPILGFSFRWILYGLIGLVAVLLLLFWWF